jgi:hypothetical protein
MEMNRVLKLAGLAVVMAVGTTHAELIIGNVSDAQMSSRQAGAQGADISFYADGDNVRIGRWDNEGNAAQQNIAGVFVFKLPDLGMQENPFTTATFNFTVKTVDNWPAMNYGADLYGLDARASSTVLASDFYVGDGPDDAADAVKLQDSILTASSSVGSKASVDIASFLNTQYAGGANIGKFVFLRINRDGSTDLAAESNGYVVYTEEWSAEAERPFISYEYTEYSAVSLFLLTKCSSQASCGIPN